MRKKANYVLLFLFSQLANFVFAQHISYPISPVIIVTDTFYGKVIADEYRWLENTTNVDVIKWIKSENTITDSCLKKASKKIDSYTLIDRYAYAEYSNPKKAGNYYFSYSFYDNVSLPALFCRESPNDDPKLLVDPNFISNKDKISLKNYAVSKNSNLLAYQFSRNGSDFAEIKVISLKTYLHKSDHLTNIKFSGISWKDDGFFYSKFLNKGFEETKNQEVYYHKIGTKQSEDSLIFKRVDIDKSFDVFTTDDERFLLIKETDKRTRVSNIFYIDYHSIEKHLLPLLTRINDNIEILDNVGDDFFAFSFKDANNGRVLKFSLSNPRQWIEVIPEYKKALLLEVKLLNDKIIAKYQTNGKQKVVVFNYKGDVLHSMELPSGYSVKGFNGEKNDKELLFSYNSYIHPPVVYKFNTQSFKTKPLRTTILNFDHLQFETKELEYKSKDGTMVSLFLLYKKGTQLNNENPLLLKAYGGFGSIETPSFDPGLVHFILSGGVFAFAKIRGGGDNGKEWAVNGRGQNKQNSFDDFISAAQYLIDNKYTNSKKLAITGGSNGGLVVCAAMVQHPELFKVAVPVVAPCDMLRFEKFTVGNFHTGEYGSISDSAGFKNLLSYSPLHNIKEHINYPATLIMTSENDDRVPPFHSYKFAAKLQNRKSQINPVLIRIEKNAGHYGAESSLYKVINEQAEMYDFILYYLKV